MPSRHPFPLTPLPLIFIADCGPPCPGSSSHEINIHSHAESHSTHDGGLVYSSHTTITSESTPPLPPPYLPLPPVYGHHLPPSRQMSTVSSRGPRLALPAPPPSIEPPPPPSYVSSPYTYTRSRSAAPSYASSSSRTARPDSLYTLSLTTTTTTTKKSTGSSRRCPPLSSRGRSHLPEQVLMLCDAPSSSASSQRRSRHSSVQDESTVAPESSVSNQTYNAERAARKDMESRGRASRRSSSHCR